MTIALSRISPWREGALQWMQSLGQAFMIGYGELIGHWPSYHGPDLGGQHAVEGQARSRRNPGGEYELIRAGADRFFVGEDLIDPVYDRLCQWGRRAAGFKLDAGSISRGVNFQQRLSCNLHLCNPRQVISSTMLSRRDLMSSLAEDSDRALLALAL